MIATKEQSKKKKKNCSFCADKIEKVDTELNKIGRNEKYDYQNV